MPRSAAARWRGQPLSAVLFDLDGTLLDTVADIALALNRTLAEYACEALAEDEVRRMIGRGSPIVISSSKQPRKNPRSRQRSSATLTG